MPDPAAEGYRLGALSGYLVPSRLSAVDSKRTPKEIASSYARALRFPRRRGMRFVRISQ
jgi:hypothetical protein